ncbi:41245_t:CDS:2 [Gigaspora margarita]|uniref:41245_t:CDS:1 n=1 Tax=Gigaspora margarita TaxID=4874 RepID=A0ABN7UE39_GIGMA|nr:41245_t:CDS:2 [Gigaspora margarita]
MKKLLLSFILAFLIITVTETSNLKKKQLSNFFVQNIRILCNSPNATSGGDCYISVEADCICGSGKHEAVCCGASKHALHSNCDMKTLPISIYGPFF